jgi:DNA-binding transcriptional regulator GbsR (MarR family)
MPIQSKGKLQLIEAVGNLCRRLGLPRTVGQIYGLLYLSPRALSLEEIAEDLGISKASASTGTRQLLTLGAIKKVWVPGNRRDLFEAVPEIGGLLRNAYREIVKPYLDAAQHRVEQVVEHLEAERDRELIGPEEFAFCQQRLEALARFQKNFQSVAPLLEKLL